MAPLTEHAVNSGNHSFVGDPTYTRSEPARPAQDAPSYQFRGSSFYGAKGSNLDFAMQADRAAADFAHAQAAAAAARAAGSGFKPLPRCAPTSSLAAAGKAALGNSGTTQLLSRDNLPHNTTVERSAAATTGIIGLPPRPGVPPELRPSLILELAHPQRNAFQREPKLNAHYNSMVLERALRWQPPALQPQPRRNRLAPPRLDPETGKPSLKVRVDSKKGPLPREDLNKSMSELWQESKQRQRRRDHDNEGRAQPRAPIHASIRFAPKAKPERESRRRGRGATVGFGGRASASSSTSEGGDGGGGDGSSSKRREAARKSAAIEAEAIAELDCFDRALRERDAGYRVMRASLDTPMTSDVGGRLGGEPGGGLGLTDEPALSGTAGQRRSRRRRARREGGGLDDGDAADSASLAEPALELFEMAITEVVPKKPHPGRSVRRVPPRPRPVEEPFMPITPVAEPLAHEEEHRSDSAMSFRISSPSIASMIKMPETQLNFHVEMKAFADPNPQLDF